MILGALAVSTAVAGERENASTNQALLRECNRYGLDYNRVLATYGGSEFDDDPRRRPLLVGLRHRRRRFGVFFYLGVNARIPALAMQFTWLWALGAVLVATALLAGWALWKATRFS